MITWFLFDLGNTVIKLAYERVIENICKSAQCNRDALLDVFDMAGGYRDMERGAATFKDFYDHIADRAGYKGTLRDFQTIWSDFFDGPIPGIESLLERVRARYRVAFLSNSNEVHAEVIPRDFPSLFTNEDRFVFSHRLKVAKPDPEIFQRALEVTGAQPQNVVFIDDLLENVIAARSIGMHAFQFEDTASLEKQLEEQGLLDPAPPQTSQP